MSEPDTNEKTVQEKEFEEALAQSGLPEEDKALWRERARRVSPEALSMFSDLCRRNFGLLDPATDLLRKKIHAEGDDEGTRAVVEEEREMLTRYLRE